MKLFTNEDEVENYLYDINKTMKEVTKTVFSLHSDLSNLHFCLCFHNPDLVVYVLLHKHINGVAFFGIFLVPFVFLMCLSVVKCLA